jgi:hypothetical protein
MRSTPKLESECPRLATPTGENNCVPVSGFARILVVSAVLIGVGGTTVPARAAAPAVCDSVKATAFRAAAARYAQARRYADAAAWFLAAKRATSECRTATDAIMHANSLFQAGSAVALSGDSQRGLALLHAAQSQLTAMIDAGDRDTAPKARAILDLIADVISAIDTIARGSM